jgi:hypothetical protein
MNKVTKMRLILGLVLLFLMTAASAATVGNGDSSQLIDKSVVTYPKSLDRYTLMKDAYDPANVGNGVSLHYILADAPRELTFDIYVYPLGRVDTAKAVDDAMVEIEGEIRAMEQRQVYSDLKFTDAVAFDIAVPLPSLLTGEREDAGASPDGAASGKASHLTEQETRAIVDAAHAAESPTKTTGRKRALTMTVSGTPQQSLASVFYRNLFLISVRATVPVSAMPADRFNVVVDRAVQDLVPTMDVQNFGTCGAIHVSVNKNPVDKDKDALAGAVQIVREVGRIRRENCASKPAPESGPPAGHSRQTIIYPAGVWK